MVAVRAKRPIPTRSHHRMKILLAVEGSQYSQWAARLLRVC
jgi:hypothetical protein